MKAPRGLSAEEVALWARLARTVTPLQGREAPPPPREGTREAESRGEGAPAAAPRRRPVAAPPAPLHQPAAGPPPRGGEDRLGLDSSWERKLARAAMHPDFTLDLHGHTLDQAHQRLDMGLGQAKAMGARLVLLITGKPRPAEAADRGARRGAIRAKVLDWLAAGPHASDIAAIRKAHRRHGGEGALYLILKRRR